MISGHGDDRHNYATIKYNFSSNVYQFADLSGLRTYLYQHLTDIHHYPEPDAQSLIQQIAKHLSLCPDQIGVTNGATEAIYLIAQAFREQHSVIVSPVFSEYADAATLHQHAVTHVFSLNEIPLNASVVWICNPNNPTGEVYDKATLQQLISERPHTYFILDHSYASFTHASLLSDQEAMTYSNVVVLHSMTKCFAIPGLRLGYLVANAPLLKRILAYRMPWSVNSLAIRAGFYLLTEPIAVNYSALLQQTQVFRQQLASLSSVNVLPTQTHYFLLQLPFPLTAAQLKHDLATQHHLLIRDASNFVGLTTQHLRVACQTTDENQRFVQCLTDWLTENQKVTL